MDKIVALAVIAEISEDSVSKGKKRKWKKDWLGEKFSNNKLLKTICETEPDDYKNYMRMSEEMFNAILIKITPLIKKKDTFMRDAISVKTRLGITLRFLATGNSFENLKFSTAVSPQAIGKIVIETCKAINLVLREYIKLPKSSDEWEKESQLFYEKTGFPHCLGAIDGKHINIKKPSKSGSCYFNYKKTFSVVLMAVVNADCEFLMVHVGTNGRISDGGVLSNTSFFDKLNNKKLGLPDPSALVPGGELLPYVFVSDDAFSLRPDLLKPYAHNNLRNDEIFFNRKLSSARVKVENSFGILASRFRILLTTINLCPEKVNTIVLTCCYLHNYLKKQQSAHSNISELPLNCQQDGFLDLEPSTSRNSSTEAKNVRNKFRDALTLLNQ